ncbi:hypothetical protein [Methylobacterium sp. J-090]|uniref:hypothetical protein n=1 Tax=Methylobacterium sp. J-090 TaxID=2836666 RepID=UPI001FBB159A|nr:hypothetical protein [Methylobacterium sp. J-090]MCJ2084308.1 hypothetical protein [Methylobacterium sp. J-090]
MSTPHHQAHARGADDGDRTSAVEASRASMRRELARAGLSPDAGRTAQATPTAIGAKASDAQANMRRQLARAGRAPA